MGLYRALSLDLGLRFSIWGRFNVTLVSKFGCWDAQPDDPKHIITLGHFPASPTLRG